VVRYSVGKNTFDNKPRNEEAETFAAFTERVLGLRSTRKGETYIAAPFNGDGTRKKEGALPRCWIPFDFDHIANPETFAELCLYLSRYRGFGYTTASHTPDAPRARAILYTDREMTRLECQRAGRAIEEDINAVFGDRVKLDGSVYRLEQPVYTPLTHSEVFVWNDGDPVDVDALLERAPSLEEEQSTQARIDAEAERDPVLKRLAERRMVINDLGQGRYAIHCPRASHHTSASSDTATVYMLPHFAGVRYGKFHCLHHHCENRPQEDFLRALSFDPQTVWREQIGHPEDVAETQRFAAPVADVDPSSPCMLHTIEGSDLLQQGFQPIRWSVPGLIPEGVTLLAGAPKLGKSWLALDIAVAVASGGHVFGSIQVDPGEVLYLALEDNDRRMQGRLRKALRGGPCPPGLHFSYDVPTMDDGLLDAISSFAAGHPDLRLVIVDTIKPIRPKEKKNDRLYDADYAVGRPFLRLAAETRLSFLLVHHTNKSRSEDELDTVSGSTGLAGGVDNILVLKRGRASAEAVLYVTGRDIEREGRFGLFWDASNAMWLLNDDGPTVAMSPERKTVYDVIRDVGPIAARDIAVVLNPGVAITRDSKEWMRVRRLVGSLRRAGLIELNENNELVLMMNTGTRGTHRDFPGG
jgi:hypothetical protein